MEALKGWSLRTPVLFREPSPRPQIPQPKSTREQHPDERRARSADQDTQSQHARRGRPIAPAMPDRDAWEQDRDQRRTRGREPCQMRAPSRLARENSLAAQRSPEQPQVQIAGQGTGQRQRHVQARHARDSGEPAAREIARPAPEQKKYTDKE